VSLDASVENCICTLTVKRTSVTGATGSTNAMYVGSLVLAIRLLRANIRVGALLSNAHGSIGRTVTVLRARRAGSASAPHTVLLVSGTFNAVSTSVDTRACVATTVWSVAPQYSAVGFSRAHVDGSTSLLYTTGRSVRASLRGSVA